jgi:hypothetical protein
MATVATIFFNFAAAQDLLFFKLSMSRVTSRLRNALLVVSFNNQGYHS